MYAVCTNWRLRVSNTSRNKKFCMSSKLSVPFCGPPNLLFSGYQRSFPGVNQPPCEVDHLLPPSVEVKNGWSYISTSLIRPHGVDRDNFAFPYVSVRSIHTCYALYSTCVHFINIDVTGKGSVSTVIDVTGSGSVSTVILFTSSDFYSHSYMSSLLIEPTPRIIPLFLLSCIIQNVSLKHFPC
jgi:hypothetical protein